MQSDRSEAELLRRALDARLTDVHTMLPGVVATYDPARQVADVRPVCSRVWYDEDTGQRVVDPLPVIPNVKVSFPFGGKITGLGKRFYLHFPLDPGDGGILIFSEASFEHWRTGGAVTAPEDLRRHGLSAPVFLPGLAPDGAPLAPPSGKVAFGCDGGERVGVDPAGFVELGADPADFVALASKVDAAFSLIETHTHLDSLAGPTGPALSAPLVNLVLAPSGSVVVKSK